MSRIFYLCLLIPLFCSCDKNAEVEKIDNKQLQIYYEKLKGLSLETLLHSNPNNIRDLKSYKDIYGWVKNEVDNFPLLFQNVISNKKVIGEDRSNSILLLWDLSDEFYPDITEYIRNENNYDPEYLIQILIKHYN